jgi:hypothetical protein
MTVGSIYRKVPMPNGYGHSGTRVDISWSGTDDLRRPARIPRLRYRTTRVVSTKIRRGKRKGQLVYKTIPYTFSVRDPNDPGTLKARHREPHAYTKSILRYDCLPCQFASGYYSNRLVGSDWAWSVVTGGDVALTNLITANDHNKLINGLWSEIKGSDFNMSVFLGESPQALRMIADTAIRVSKSVWHLRQGDAGGALRSLVEGTSRAPLVRRFDANHALSRYPNLRGDARAQANLFLEMQYGWRPLLSDVKAASEALAQQLEFPFRKKITKRIEVKGANKRTGGGSYWTYNESAFLPGQFSVRRSDTHMRMITAYFSEEPSLAAKLGLLDPELVAWELVPFSFVADWFIPIGSYLEARGAASKMTGLFVTSDKRVRSEWGITTSGSLATNIPGGIPGTFTRGWFTRSLSTNLTAAVPEMKPLNKVATWEHAANAIALVTSIFTNPQGLGSRIQSIRSR